MANKAVPEEPEYDDPYDAVFYAVYNADHPLTFEMIGDRGETNGHNDEALRQAIEDRNLETVEYGDQIAFYLGQESHISVEIDREMYEELRTEGCSIGEDPYGVKVHISENYRSVQGREDGDVSEEMDAWAPMFPVEDESDLDRTETQTGHRSKTVMLEGVPKDTIKITEVHEGMHRIPEKLQIGRRTNTYYGPTLKLWPTDDWDGEDHVFELTCPDRFSHLILWRGVTDDEGYVYNWAKVSKVSAEIFNVDGYDICEGCGEPIKDPMHRSMALFGQCQGGFNEQGEQGDDRDA